MSDKMPDRQTVAFPHMIRAPFYFSFFLIFQAGDQLERHAGKPCIVAQRMRIPYKCAFGEISQCTCTMLKVISQKPSKLWALLSIPSWYTFPKNEINFGVFQHEYPVKQNASKFHELDQNYIKPPKSIRQPKRYHFSYWFSGPKSASSDERRQLITG